MWPTANTANNAIGHIYFIKVASPIPYTKCAIKSSQQKTYKHMLLIIYNACIKKLQNPSTPYTSSYSFIPLAASSSVTLLR